MSEAINKWPLWPQIHFETTERFIYAQSCVRKKTKKGEWIFERFCQSELLRGEVDKEKYLKNRMSDLHRSVIEHEVPFFMDKLIWPHTDEAVYILDENQNQ